MKLAVGAAGTRAAIQRLAELGFEPIELERGSTGFKIWKKIKIKRVRVPDILCLKSGLRFESRGKTNLEISMSHSKADPARAWDAGMRGDDRVGLVLCEQASASIVDWRPASPIHFVTVKDLRDAFRKGQVNVTEPKGVEEGSEIRIIWPSVAARERSTVTEITSGSITLAPVSGGRPQRCLLARKKPLRPLCKKGDTVEQNQLVAATVPIALEIRCPSNVGEKFFRDRLTSTSLSERYAAAKALRFRGTSQAVTSLRERLNDDDEDIYVKLEAAAALAANGQQEGWKYLRECSSSSFEQVQLETIIVLSEIKSPLSEQLLISVLADSARHEEIRAGAAWALGEFETAHAARALTETFDQASRDVKVEAARALLKIAPSQVSLLLELIRQSPAQRRDGLAWALARHGGFEAAELISAKADDNLRRWTAYIVGYGKSRFLEASIERLCQRDPEVYFSASVLWQLLSSWINELKEY